MRVKLFVIVLFALAQCIAGQFQKGTKELHRSCTFRPVTHFGRAIRNYINVKSRNITAKRFKTRLILSRLSTAFDRDRKKIFCYLTYDIRSSIFCAKRSENTRVIGGRRRKFVSFMPARSLIARNPTLARMTL